MTVINTNVGAITARTYATNSSSFIEDNLGKLSSGRRVNSGSDDAAGLAVANKLEAQLRSTNMAIQNASNGVSLIQTAGSGMNKVNSMLVRIREVSVQMANGIYTDKDRANAQAEVTLLLEEIDKISENLQFNQVYLLDGSYEQSFRTGVSNEESFGLSIISQRAEELGKEAGLKAFGTTLNSSQHALSRENLSVSVTEAPSIELNLDQMGAGFQAFVSNNVNTLFEITDDPASKFTVDHTGRVSATAVSFDTAYPENNTYTFTVKATSNSNFFENKITLSVNQNQTSAVVKSSQTDLTVAESANLSFRSVDSDNATDGMLSNSLQSFVTADSGSGQFSIAGGADAAVFSVDQTSGVVSAAIEYEDFSDADSDNVFNFNVKYTSSTGDEFLETVQLTVTDAQEEEVEYVIPFAPVLMTPSRFSLQIDNTTINTAAMSPGPVSFSEMASLLNSANTINSSPARASFSGTANGVQAKFKNSAGDVSNALTASPIEVSSRLEYSTAFVDRVTAVDGAAAQKTYTELSGALNAAQAGDTFTYNFNGNVISATVSTNKTKGNYSVGDLAADLNAANSNGGSPQAVLFTSNGDALVATRTIDGNFSASLLGDVTFNGKTLSSAGTSSNGVTSQNRVVELNALPWTFSLGGGDIPEIVIDGVRYAGAATPALGMQPEVAASLNNILSSQGISVTESLGVLRFTITGASASTANAINFEEIELWSDGFAASMATNRTDADTVVSYAGARNNSVNGRDNSTSGNNTDGAETTTLALAKANLNESQSSATHSIINFEDNFTISLKKSDYATEFSNFIETNPFGSFKISGEDKAFFKIDAFNGTLKTTALFKSNPKDQYSVEVNYTGKNGQSLSNQLTLNRDPLQNVVRDSVADVDISTSEGAAEAITILDRAINQMAAQEAEMGAAQNRLEHAIDYLSMAGLNTAASKSRIVDADFADISSKLAKHQILNQASTSMLAQANSSKQMLMQLLR